MPVNILVYLVPMKGNIHLTLQWHYTVFRNHYLLEIIIPILPEKWLANK